MSEKARGELTLARIENMQNHCKRVITTLAIKNPKYGESWKSHGGFSAFFNMQRKFSRIETLSEQYGYDIFKAIQQTGDEPDGMVETIMDQIGYLLLILDDQVEATPNGPRVINDPRRPGKPPRDTGEF